MTGGRETNANQFILTAVKCERAASLLKSVHLDEVVVYEKGKHFTEGQFRDEFGDEVEYPMISIGMFNYFERDYELHEPERNVCVTHYTKALD